MSRTLSGPAGLSTAAAVSGYLAFVAGPGLSIAAIILGHMAHRREPASGHMWRQGLIAGYVGLLGHIIFIVYSDPILSALTRFVAWLM